MQQPPTLAQALWLNQPALAHQQWRASLLVAERHYALQSQRLYLSLFGRFCTWLHQHQTDLKRVSTVGLTVFLDSLQGRDGGSASSRTQRTYLAEIDRVFVYLQSLELRADNPATTLLETLRVSTPLRPRSIHLPKPNTRALYLQSLYRQNLSEAAPEHLQSRAMNMLMLDCGLTLKEIQKLSLKHVERVGDGVVIAAGHRLLKERLLQLTPEAQKWLLLWLQVRKGLNVMSRSQYLARQRESMGLPPSGTSKLRQPRSTVFVGFTGKSDYPHGQRGSGLVIDLLSDKTIYLSAQEVMLAGVDAQAKVHAVLHNKGPQTLRNLCCAALISGKTMRPSEIAAYLGLRRVDQVWAMVRALKDLAPA